jgi:hypothetical protein
MRPLVRLAAPAAAAVFMLLSAPAAARLLIEIDKPTQTMTVSRDGRVLHRWPVSTGLQRYATPSGEFKPFRMEEDHFSREWDDAPMPHSIFFTMKGHAIHGTNHLRQIGRPASHGCVRLEPANARALFEMVKREGLANTRVVLQGDTPPANSPALARLPRQRAAVAEPPADYEPPRYRGPYDPPRYEPEPGYQTRPRYLDPQAGARDATADPRAPAYRPPPNPPGQPRIGYWVLYPDGRRVFVDGEYQPPPGPARYFFR